MSGVPEASGSFGGERGSGGERSFGIGGKFVPFARYIPGGNVRSGFLKHRHFRTDSDRKEKKNFAEI